MRRRRQRFVMDHVMNVQLNAKMHALNRKGSKVKILRLFAITALLFSWQNIHAMGKQIIRENIESKVSAINRLVQNTQEKMRLARNVDKRILLAQETFTVLYRDVNKIVFLGLGQEEAYRVSLYNRLHDEITPLYKSYQQYSLQDDTNSREIDDMWSGIIQRLNHLIELEP